MQLYRQTKLLHWTAHAQNKMRYYKLSEPRVRRVLHSPDRIEVGIAPETIAVMQTQKGPKNSHEIWAMVVEEKKRRKIISAWRYPGTTKPGERLPVEILAEFESGVALVSAKPKPKFSSAQKFQSKKLNKWFKRPVKGSNKPANAL